MSPLPRAVLVDVIPPRMNITQAKRRLDELDSLMRTYGGVTVVRIIQKRDVPNYRTYVGSGKLAEILKLAGEEKIDLLIMNNLLKPKQMFALEEALRPYHVKPWDRIDLILKIFSKHAQTVEAKLQIKLAAIKHMGPRIFGMGMEMMQQAGGIGTRGIGETNTEIMKRHLAMQTRQTEKELEGITRTRQQHRVRRSRIGFKTVSIVGYTNAGKSSLLNALTHKGAFVADALFATLDTRVGKLWLPETQTSVLVSDTIGFIQQLPPQLIQAFRSTLDETVAADLLLHVIDVADKHREAKIREVEDILRQIGAADIPALYVFTKVDTLKRLPRAKLKQTYHEYTPVFVSARSGAGLDELRAQITKRLKEL